MVDREAGTSVPALELASWGPEQAAALSELVATALPDEGLQRDELLACCWDDPGVVLATAAGDGAVAAVVRGTGRHRTGCVKLLAVAPGSRRRGLGAGLLHAAESWLAQRGAHHLVLGGGAPFYLWPGVDVRFTAMLCLAERAGYAVEGAELDLSCPTTFRAPPPDGVEVRRVLEDEEVAAATALAHEHWPWWVPELARGIEHGSAFVAVEAETPRRDLLGFACHSVNRAGWVGPMATRPDRQGGGIGSALLGELCRDLMVAGHADAEIAWVGPVSFYARTAGASVSRVYRTFRKRSSRA